MAEIAKTLDQGLELLRLVSDEGPGTVADLAARSGINRTVVHRLVTTLELRGFVQRDDRGGVGLGSTLIELGGRVRPDLRAATRAPLQMLALRLQETAVLSVAEEGEAVAIDQYAGGSHLLRVDYRPGLRHSIARAAHGKAMLAFVDDQPDQAAQPAADVELTTIRYRGYATSQDELQAGAAGIAAPIFGRDGRVVGSIGVVAPLERMPPEEIAAAAVLEAAADSSRRLGHKNQIRS